MSMFSWRDATDTREMYQDAERRAAIERRDRERQERERAEEYRRQVQKRIDDRLREIQLQRAEREAAAEQREAERGERILARLEAARSGRPYTPSGGSYDNPVASWKAAVAECLALCHGDRRRAVCLANERNPGLRQAVIAVANAAR